MKIVVLCSLFIVCAGCTLHKANREQEFLEKTLLAKYSDIPDAPFHTVLQTVIAEENRPGQVQITYTTTMSQSQVIDFYEQEMERLGWNFIGKSLAKDVLLQYSKPDVFCSILLQQKKITVFVVQRKGA